MGEKQIVTGTEDTGTPAAAPKKKKRHFILWVLLIALGLLSAGEFVGRFLVEFILHAIPDMSAGMVFALVNYLPFIGIDLVVLLYCAWAEKEVFHSFLPRSKNGGRGNTGKLLAIGLLAGFLTNAGCILIAWLHGDLHFSVGYFDVGYMLLALLVVFIQSGAEELLTRGYIFGALRQRYPVWVAAAANALLFGALHLGNPGVTVLSIVDIVLTGIAWSIVMIYLDSIWFCIAMHTAWNFNQNFLFGLPNSGLVSESSFLHLEAAKDSLVYDTAFGVEGTIVSTLMMIATGVCVVLYARKKNSRMIQPD